MSSVAWLRSASQPLRLLPRLHLSLPCSSICSSPPLTLPLPFSTPLAISRFQFILFFSSAGVSLSLGGSSVYSLIIPSPSHKRNAGGSEARHPTPLAPSSYHGPVVSGAAWASWSPVPVSGYSSLRGRCHGGAGRWHLEISVWNGKCCWETGDTARPAATACRSLPAAHSLPTGGRKHNRVLRFPSRRHLVTVQAVGVTWPEAMTSPGACLLRLAPLVWWDISMRDTPGSWWVTRLAGLGDHCAPVDTDLCEREEIKKWKRAPPPNPVEVCYSGDISNG